MKNGRSDGSTILVADVPEGVRTIRKVLGSRAEIVAIYTLGEADTTFERGFDLIVCGIHFDDSRMFDLLRRAKAHPAVRDVPFICFRDLDSELISALFQSLEISCRALGAERFVDLYHLRRRHGTKEGDERLRSIIFHLLGTSI